MNWVDATIVGVVVAYALSGLRRGFLAGIAEIATIAAGFGAAMVMYRTAGTSVAASLGWRPGITQAMTFIVVWIVMQYVLGLGAKRWHHSLPEAARKSRLNRALGMAPAGLKGLVIAALLATLLSVSPAGPAASDVDASRIGPPLVAVVVDSEKAAYNTFGDAIREVQEAFFSGEVEGSRDLGFHTTDAEPDPDAEARMLNMINAERMKRGLHPLVPDETLRKVARQHSVDMLARGYFAHDTPSGVTPFQRMHRAGIVYGKAGENLALALTLETAHDRLMRSKGHRENILDPGFHKVGVGALRTRIRGTMFTQDFTN